LQKVAGGRRVGEEWCAFARGRLASTNSGWKSPTWKGTARGVSRGLNNTSKCLKFLYQGVVVV